LDTEVSVRFYGCHPKWSKKSPYYPWPMIGTEGWTRAVANKRIRMEAEKDKVNFLY